MKKKRRQLWTPEQVQRWLEDCTPYTGKPVYCFAGWFVDGTIYCAECVHTLVENGHPLPPEMVMDEYPYRGSYVIPFSAYRTEKWLRKERCNGCGGKLKT
jgi:hypothetical protein